MKLSLVGSWVAEGCASLLRRQAEIKHDCRVLTGPGLGGQQGSYWPWARGTVGFSLVLCWADSGILILVSQPSYMLQSEELRASLLARYPPEKLFQVERNFNAAQDLDVPLLEGDLVGVIKKKDPMGSQNRWLIDNGGECSRLWVNVTE